MHRRRSTDEELRDNVRRCLLLHWDPIGVREILEATDEYDPYVPGVCTLLSDGADARKLRQHLVHLETVNMGKSAPVANIDEVVRKLLELVIH